MHAHIHRATRLPGPWSSSPHTRCPFMTTSSSAASARSLWERAITVSCGRRCSERDTEPSTPGRGGPCCTSLCEQVASLRDELLDGLRGSAGDLLDRGGHAVIPI